MNQKEKFSQSGKDYNFDLDAYIAEQSRQTNLNQKEEEHREQDRSYRFKNFFLVFAVVFASVLWYHDWSPAQAWASFFGNDETVTVASSQFAPPAPTIPGIPVPEIPSVSRNALLNENMVEYLALSKEHGFDDHFSTIGIQNLYNANVPIEYLQQLDEIGILEDLSFPAVIAYFSSDVSLDYISVLQEAGIFEEFSFPAVIALSSGNVSVDYIRSLHEGGFLQDLSYPAIIALHENGVPVEFLEILEDRDLLSDMSFPEIIRLYKADN